MSEEQSHGFVFEEHIRCKVYNIDARVPYHSEVDIPRELNSIENADVSIKTCGLRNTLCLGDASRFYNFTKGVCHIIVMWYRQESSSETKEIVDIVHFDLSNLDSELWGSLTANDISKLDALVKTVSPKSRPTASQSAAIKAMRSEMRSGRVSLSVKCNSQQSRLQCTFSGFRDFVKMHPERILHSGIRRDAPQGGVTFRNVFIPDISKSPPRRETGLRRTSSLEQYYTRPHVADMCVDVVTRLFPSVKVWLEPSAGEGAFVDALKRKKPDVRCVAIDIDPKRGDILRYDFLMDNVDAEYHRLSSDSTVMFGNPPFGRQSSTAKKFIRKGCALFDRVALILPRSFSKPSMYSTFPRSFHLLETLEMPHQSFVVADRPIDVPCIFQVWEKRNEMRPKAVVPLLPPAFTLVKKTEPYHIAVRRVGGSAGMCSAPSETLKPQCFYFLRINDMAHFSAEKVKASLEKQTFKHDTLGPKSISKSQLINAIRSFC